MESFIELYFSIYRQNTTCPTRYNCQGSRRAQCEGIVRQYQAQINDDIELIEEEPESHDPQILRHVVLLILLLCSMFVVVTPIKLTISSIQTIILISRVLLCVFGP